LRIFSWQEEGEEGRWEMVPTMIDFYWDQEQTKEAIWSQGRKRKGFLGLAELSRLLLMGKEIEPKFSYSQEKLNLLINEITQTVDKPVQEALFEFQGSKVANFQLSSEGRLVNQEEVNSLILMTFKQNLTEKPTVVFELPVSSLLPEIATSQTNQMGIKEYLGEGESFFYGSSAARIHNLTLAASLLHGVIIPPGETFSFLERIGQVSAATGYRPAWVIKDRQTILEDGGGVCQVSTTLFRAALNTGFPIVERKAHYYRVGYYESGGYPMGLDATVYPPAPDLKFKNDTTAYLLIQTKVDQQKQRLAFEIYGTSDQRRVEVDKPVVHSQSPAPETIYIDDPTLSPGIVIRVDWAHPGAKVSVTRRVWDQASNLKEERTFWSNYVPWPAAFRRGV